MADLILHHYPNSPFSEKVRLILGYKKLPWKSVIIPAIMPKPDVQALTGGYRRTPFMQVGADIYCDSALICDVLEHLQPAPPIYPEPGNGRTVRCSGRPWRTACSPRAQPRCSAAPRPKQARHSAKTGRP